VTPFINLYRRLDLIQQTRWFRVAGSVLALVLCAGYFGPLLVKSYDLHEQRLRLGQALIGQSLTEGDEHALSLRADGTVTVGGRTYGGPHLARRAALLFDSEGFIAAPGRLVEELLADQRPAWAPRFLLEQPGTTWMLAILAVGFLLLVVWIKVVVAFVLTLLGTAVPVAVCGGLGWEQAMVACAGMGLLTFTFVLLTRALLVAFQFPHQILAVAHTVVKEASRSRLSLVFVILLLVGLPLLPIWLDPEAPLRFRIQTFISRSLGMTYALAACMTLFLACATVAFEIRDRQIWQLMAKPLSRINYLLGKWLGVLAVNAVILVVAGVSIFTYIKYLSQLPVAPGLEGTLDRLAVRDEVLTARVGARPRIEGLVPQQLRARVEQVIARDPKLADQEEVPAAVKRRLAREIQDGYIEAQRSILPIDPALPPGRNERTYVFEGLGPARSLQSSLTLRYRFHILGDDEHKTFPVGYVFNGDPETATRRQYIPTVTHVLPVGTDLIRDDGTMAITLVNLFVTGPEVKGRGELNFEEDDFEVLYRVASFESNFIRAVVVTWVKLGFLAMLGIAASTLLSFPVACLLSFTIFLGGTIGPFLALSLKEYYPPETSQMDWTNVGLVLQWLFQSFIKATAQGLVFALHSFGEYRPAQSLVEGRLIAWRTVLGGLFWLGIVWSGVAMVFGLLVIRNRQLAIYSGHG
jgi:hypothetical protein